MCGVGDERQGAVRRWRASMAKERRCIFSGRWCPHARLCDYNRAIGGEVSPIAMCNVAVICEFNSCKTCPEKRLCADVIIRGGRSERYVCWREAREKWNEKSGIGV